MRKFLLITYYWPPASGPGVQRWLKMCNYIEKYGWQPVILTVQDGSYPATDLKLTKEIKDHWKVFKTKSLEPIALYNKLQGQDPKKSVVGIDQSSEEPSVFKRWVTTFGIYLRSNVFIPDARIGWKYYAFPKAKKILQSMDIEAVVTTGPPQSTHLIGLQCSQKLGIPWLTDFRDPWTTAYYNANLNRSSRAIKKDKKLEDAVLQSANAVSCISPAMVYEFQDRNQHIELIYNGFDPADFEHVTANKSSEFFEMHYVGTLKNLEIQEDLWTSIQELQKETDGFRQKFRLHFTGNIAPSVKRSLEEFELLDICIFHGFASHEEAIQRMHDAHLLLLIIAELPGNNKVITGKIFEYLASNTDILAIGPVGGGADQVLKKAGRNGILDYRQKKDYKSYINDRFQRWSKHPTSFNQQKQSVPSLFSRDYQAKQIALILERISRSE